MPEDEQAVEEQATCGTGLAQSSQLPQRLADVVDALAGVLRHHLTAIDPEDEASTPEYEAYKSLATAGEQIAGRLHTLADEMAGYRSLPMANHDMEAMSSHRMLTNFEALVNAKRDLRQFLETGDEEDQEMLREMRA